MSNRIIKDLIWTSPRLARCSIEAQLHFPRLILLSDDWGCFNGDADVIHGLAYPKMKISPKKIAVILSELGDHGLLFRWQDGLHGWGFWVKWDDHQYSSGTSVNGAGQRVKHRRKTPEPPSDQLKSYINQHYTKKLEHLGTSRDNAAQTASNLNLNPKPNPNPNICAPELDSLFEKWWKRYPRNDDKGKGKEKWLALVNTGINPQTLEDALTGYINCLNSKNTDIEYVKHAKTFLYAGNPSKNIPSTWEPYLKYADLKYKAKAEL